jgi:hypothetical protein
MSKNYCPICFIKLEVKDVAPCMECGHLDEEIEHALAGIHTYYEMRIFGELSLILCDFCQVDFGSFHPEFFSLPPNARIGFGKMQFIRSIDNYSIQKDKFCPDCRHRIQFLNFVYQAREFNQQNEQ